jgi:hypothetical protein
LRDDGAQPIPTHPAELASTIPATPVSGTVATDEQNRAQDGGELSPWSKASRASRKSGYGAAVDSLIKPLVFAGALLQETWRSGDRAHASSVMRRWPWWSLLPLGFGSWWLPYAGVYARRPSWAALGAPWLLCAVVGWVGAFAASRGRTPDLDATLIFVSWGGSALFSFAARAVWVRRTESPS